MLEFSWFICGILYFILYCYLFNNLICKDKFEINSKIVIFSVLIGFIYYLISQSNYIYLRPYALHIYCFFTLLYIYKKSVVKTLIGIFYLILITLISELIYDAIYKFAMHGDLVEVTSTPAGYLISNFIISIIAIFLSNLKNIKRYFENVISWYNKSELKTLAIFVIMAISIVVFVSYSNFANMLPKSVLLIANLFFLVVLLFVAGFFREKSKNNKIKIEYDELMKYITKYEKIIDEKSKNQHEYKNQLIFIKGMLNKNNKKAIEYIDSLYKNENDDLNVELIRKLQYLPQGGLKGLIYYKIDEMLSKDIEVFVDISSNLKFGKEIKNNLQDISKVIGVYLDNAIEAAVMAKDKYIIIEIYQEKGNIIFSFSNTYSGTIHLDKVDKEGYTTKGKGKGYGLSLVKDIIDHNDILSQEKTINGMYYVQKLVIKK